MTNFENYARSPELLAMLIEKVVDDALEAEGCSLNLKYPEGLSSAKDDRLVTWESWLKEEM